MCGFCYRGNLLCGASGPDTALSREKKWTVCVLVCVCVCVCACVCVCVCVCVCEREREREDTVTGKLQSHPLPSHPRRVTWPHIVWCNLIIFCNRHTPRLYLHIDLLPSLHAHTHMQHTCDTHATHTNAVTTQHMCASHHTPLYIHSASEC